MSVQNNPLKSPRLYFYEPALFVHSTIVKDIVNLTQVELDDTIFHPQGGGQPSDKGFIAGLPVIAVSEDKATGQVLHQLSSAPDFKPGDTVNMTIDADFRILCSRLHSAGHLIAAVAEKIYPQVKAVKGHHFPGEANVVFQAEEITTFPDISEFISTIQSRVNFAISSKTPMTSNYDPVDGRKVQIAGFDLTPCGGTHVCDMSDIGVVEIAKGKMKKGQLKLSYSVK